MCNKNTVECMAMGGHSDDLNALVHDKVPDDGITERYKNAPYGAGFKCDVHKL